MDQNTKVVIIVPAYNAEGSINQVINALPLWVDCIIVVNDRSMDNTFQIVQGNTDTRLILLENQENLGVGGAMKRGYQEALAQGADIIVKMDSDGQMDPAYLPQLLAPIISGNANYTKGNRFLHTTWDCLL
jgi:dolichol-phosphate mannosyltransferase